MAVISSRPLRGQELAAALRKVDQCYSVVIVAGDYSVDLIPEVLFPALAEVVQNEVTLSAMVFGNDSDGYDVRRLDTFDLGDVVIYEPHLTRDTLIPGTDSEFLPYNQTELPLWRLRIINNDRTAVFMYDHTVMDGVVGPIFHQRLLTALNKSVEAHHVESLKTVVVAPKVDLPPALVTALTLPSPSRWDKLVAMIQGWLNNVRSAVSRLVGAVPDYDPLRYLVEFPSRGYVGFVRLDKDQTKRLVERSRSLGVTVLCAVTAAYVRASINCNVTEQRDRAFTYKCFHAVTGRRFLGPSWAAAFGNYFMGFLNCQRVIPSQFSMVKYAQSLMSDLKIAVTGRDRSMLVSWGILSDMNVEDNHRVNFDSVGKPASDHLCTSNLGQIRTSHISGPVQLTELWFVGPPIQSFSRSLISFVSVENGPLVISITEAGKGGEELVKREAEEMKANLLEWID